MTQEKEYPQVFCFDLQQVQNLSELPIGDGYNLRQLSFYNSCTTDYETHLSFLDQNSDSKRSQRSSFCLINLINCNVLPDCKVLRLFADGCTEQKKHFYMMYSLAVWFSTRTHTILQKIRIMFTVIFSFSPDRVFRRIKQIEVL